MPCRAQSDQTPLLHHPVQLKLSDPKTGCWSHTPRERDHRVIQHIQVTLSARAQTLNGKFLHTRSPDDVTSVFVRCPALSSLPARDQTLRLVSCQHLY